MSHLGAWLAVAGLGAYHGINPSMGWLFAVALGLQERSRARVIWSLFPLAVGHLISIGVVVALIAALRAFVSLSLLRPIGAGILIAFGLFRYFWPMAHPRWVAMRVNGAELALWSFLMATAHGAGLMLFPILIDLAPGVASHSHHMPALPHFHPILQASLVVIIHTGAMLVVMGTVAVLIYDRFGLAILRSAWINLDTIWAFALVAAGLISLVV